ncbi:MAG TPA: NAD-dependent epimerase/dehydratase family protein [Thermoanaerobaculia bacterium]|nr:NAD-dependent epimerase/dehydratase family protein [Thermoanaerobaculia bacterium]
MRIAITGGTGFVGSHLTRRLRAEGHEVLALSRRDPLDFTGCDAVAHCAGINREIGAQTYERVHVERTRDVIAEARRAGVKKLVFLSFLRARPDCGSRYHESKWEAEELVRASGLDFTVVKSGMIYGRGDHMLDHLSHALQTFPLFLSVGLREKPVWPVAIDDMVEVLRAALVDGRLSRETVAVTGAEELMLSEAARRVGRVLGVKTRIFPAPLWVHRALAHVWEWTMKVPLAAVAQVRILSEGVVEAAPFASQLPDDLLPRRRFTDDQIRAGLPERGGFTLRDLRCYSFTPR